ncbi:hypothetical protein [Clavibacter californiensis]|uniref:hypothetical protein n=1 Tax=Clavibacter californiensis TaxID=1401995 RepID=UPI0011C23358|nr:hypothetical protein [Clavibacter californiensis]UKF81712.1 hypothetical protein FGD68_15230 [Clavibacter californiensis]
MADHTTDSGAHARKLPKMPVVDAGELLTWKKRFGVIFTGWQITKLVIASLLCTALFIAFFMNGELAVVGVIGSAILLLLKELSSTFARDENLEDAKHGFEDAAAVCSLFAVVFGAPAIAATINGLT